GQVGPALAYLHRQPEAALRPAPLWHLPAPSGSGSWLAALDAYEPVAQRRLAGWPYGARELGRRACPGHWGVVGAPTGFLLVSWSCTPGSGVRSGARSGSR